MGSVNLSGTGWLNLTPLPHLSGQVSLGAVGTLHPLGRPGSHAGVSEVLLSGRGTLSTVGRVVIPFRPPTDLRYTREATPIIVER